MRSSSVLRGPRRQAVGVEIGTSAIKMVSLRPGSPPVVEQAIMVPTPADSVQDGAITAPQAVADTIRGALREHGVRAKYAVSTIPNASAITRNVMVPRMKQRELRSAIRWEAERYIPFPIDEVSLDYQLLDALTDEEIAEEGQMEVLIAAAPLEVVSRQVQVLRLAGLEPTVIDLRPFAALRALHGNLLGSRLSKTTLTDGPAALNSEVALVLEIGAGGSAITLVRGDRVLMTRNINVSADDFTVALQRAFDIPDFVDAEAVKLSQGAASVSAGLRDTFDFTLGGEYPPGKVFEVIRPVLTDLLTEVRRSLEFYRVQAGDVTVDRTLLCGGGAKLRGLPAAIGDALGFRVEVGSPWLGVRVEESRFEPGYLEEHGPEFTVPVGLALRGVARG